MEAYMGRNKKIDGEAFIEEPNDDEAQLFRTITRREHDLLIHDSELVRCLIINGLFESDVYKDTMKTFYPDGINEDDWRKDR
jgi:hypothetical protein